MDCPEGYKGIDIDRRGPSTEQEARLNANNVGGGYVVK